MPGPGYYGNKKPTYTLGELSKSRGKKARIYQLIAKDQPRRFKGYIAKHGTKPPMGLVMRWGRQKKNRLR